MLSQCLKLQKTCCLLFLNDTCYFQDVDKWQLLCLVSWLSENDQTCAVKEEKTEEDYDGLNCLSGKDQSQRPRALSTTVESVYGEEVTHDVHVLLLLPHCLVGLFSYALHCQLTARASDPHTHCDPSAKTCASHLLQNLRNHSLWVHPSNTAWLILHAPLIRRSFN